jgi:phosphatidylglycerol:prolipoprotein diacylglycerol transferase
MFSHTLNPVIFALGAVEIRWYGLMYVLGFVFAYYFIPKISGRFGVDLSRDDVSELLLYLAVGMLVFARLAEVLVYHPSYYFSNPQDIPAVWKGGLSFHGGLLGFIIGGFIYAKKKKISFLVLADVVVLPAVIGLFLGRIGNFINGELAGRITSVPWCVNFRNYEGCRHPSQIYEAFKNLFIFGVLWHFKDKKPAGFLFFLFLILYSILRAVIEQFFRQPETYILGITTGQFLSIFMFLAGVYGMAFIYDKRSEVKTCGGSA